MYVYMCVMYVKNMLDQLSLVQYLHINAKLAILIQHYVILLKVVY